VSGGAGEQRLPPHRPSALPSREPDPHERGDRVDHKDRTVTAPARWYHLQGEEQHGPTDLASIRDLVLDGTILPDTYVWSDGMPDWLPAGQVPALTPPDEVRRQLAGWG
jgi:hypothetical protein